MVVPEEPGDPDVRKLAATDEILQVMYWLHGEKLIESVSASELSRWVALAASDIAPLLERMRISGLIEEVDAAESSEAPRYVLTTFGLQEGGRRFADEFAELTRQGHGECNDPGCDCHASGNPAECRHRHA